MNTIELKKLLFERTFKLVFSGEKCKIYELRAGLDNSSFNIFCFLSDKKLDSVCMTQTQIVYICQKYPKQFVGSSTTVTTALLKTEQESDLFFVDLTVRKEGMIISARTIDTSSGYTKKRILVFE